MMGLISSGKIWPYAIAGSIVMVFGFCVATVMVTQTRPVENSDEYMMNYHHVDLSANELIQAKIDFDKKYNIAYISNELLQNNARISYKITDKNNKPINDAKIDIVITRPNNHTYDQRFNAPQVLDGIYSFSNINLEQPGRWNILAKIAIGEHQRFYNLKADTRAKEAFEY